MLLSISLPPSQPQLVSATCVASPTYLMAQRHMYKTNSDNSLGMLRLGCVRAGHAADCNKVPRQHFQLPGLAESPDDDLVLVGHIQQLACAAQCLVPTNDLDGSALVLGQHRLQVGLCLQQATRIIGKSI